MKRDTAFLNLVFLLAIVLSLLSIAQIDGYSTGVWRSYIEPDTVDPRIIYGQARSIRGDDYHVMIPLKLAQVAHSPKFPVHNSLIGPEGMNALVALGLPVKHVVAVFRPETWGYYIHAGFGLSWNWWFLIFALLGSTAATIKVVCPKLDSKFAIVGGLLLCLTPFFQFWSFNFANVAAYGLGTFVSFYYGLKTLSGPHSVRAATVQGMLTGWLATSFALTLYTPFQVTLAWLLIPVTIAVSWRDNLVRGLKTKTFVIFLLCILLVLGVGCGLFLNDSIDAIKLTLQTVYPGQRSSEGGTFSPIRMFSNYILTFFQQPEDRTAGVLRNTSEEGNAIYVFPLVMVLFLREYLFVAWSRDKAKSLCVSLAIMLALFIYLIWSFWDLPEGLSKILLLNKVPPTRLSFGFVIADVLLLCVWLEHQSTQLSWTKAVVGATLLGSIAFYFSRVIQDTIYDNQILPNYLILYATISSAVVGVLVGLRRKSAMVMLAVLSAITSLWFNPLQVSGVEYIYENPLSQRIAALSKESEGEANWALFRGPHLANIFRAIGVKSINGLHFYPQFPMWRILDPEARFQDSYNRCCHVVFEFNSDINELKISNPDTAIIRVDVHPDNQRFLELGVTHLIFNSVSPGELVHWKEVDRYRNFQFYVRKDL